MKIEEGHFEIEMHFVCIIFILIVPLNQLPPSYFDCRYTDKYKFNTLPLPRKHRNKRNSTSSETSTERVTRKKSFVDMAKRKISRGNKDQATTQVETPKKVGVDKVSPPPPCKNYKLQL